MEEINPNKNTKDLNIFKEEILTHIKDLEKKLTTQISNKESKLNQDYEEFTSKMNSIIENNKEMVSNIVSQKIKLEKISELESFKNKVDDMLITHEVRIKNSIEDIERMKTKYDKIVTDNLYVSGFIGNSCQFRNVSEYLSYNISEVSKLKLEREQYKKDIKEVKNKLDGTMKNMITLNDNSVKLCNKYTDNKQEEFRKLLQATQTELNQKSMEMKAMIQQFHNESDQKINNLKKEFNKLLDMKNDFNNLIEEKYINFIKKFEEINEKILKSNENMEVNNKKLDDNEVQINNLDKAIKDLSFQVRNYYCVNNKIAGLLEQLGANPSKSEITKLLLGVQNNSINAEEKRSNKALLSMSVSPQPKRRIPKKNSNLDFVQLKLDESVQITNNNTNNNNIINNNYINNKPKKLITKSVINFSSDKKVIFNKIGLKKNNLVSEYNSESDSSTINIIDETTNKNDNKENKDTKDKKNIEKAKPNLKPILKQNLKQNIKDNIIKQSIKENENLNIKENNIENSKENEKINTIREKKENLRVNFKDNDNLIKSDIKANDNENKKDNNIKEKTNNSRQNITSLKKPEIISIKNNNNIKNSLPLLGLGKNSESLCEIKKVNLSASNIDKNIDVKNNKKKLVMIFDNDNKIKHNYQKNIMKKIDLDLEQDKQACKVVSLNLPVNNLTKPSININKKKNENKGKYNVVNSLINEYRAKLFSKAHSPETVTDITNEILDIPKKVSQAFGRTTYTFYFKKDAIDCANANKNINNFGYNGPKRGYRFKNNKRVDTGDFKTYKKNQI